MKINKLLITGLVITFFTVSMTGCARHIYSALRPERAKMDRVNKTPYYYAKIEQRRKAIERYNATTQPTLLAAYTPAIGDSYTKIVKNLGPADDKYTMKNENGEEVPGEMIAGWFTVKNGKLVRAISLSIENGIVIGVLERKSPKAMGLLKAYLVTRAATAYNPSEFVALALANESSSNNIN